jgi:hypothetical protein
MPEMKSLRNFVLRTLSGHMIRFEPEVPTKVPQAAVQDALNAGCVIIDPAELQAYEDTRALKTDFRDNIRESLVFLAIKAIAERNDTKEFNSGGVPKESAVASRLGMGNVSQKEVEDLYKKYKASNTGGEEFAVAPEAANVLKVIEASEQAELKLLAEEFGCVEAVKGRTSREMRSILIAKFTGTSK